MYRAGGGHFRANERTLILGLVIRPASKVDIDAFSALPNKPTTKALVGEVDGTIIGLGGLALRKGRYFAFCDISSQDAAPYRLHIARAAIRFLAEARAQGIRYIYATASLDEPLAPKWLARLGFRPDPRHPHLYRWSAT